jgi:hypothetical protein
MERPGIVFRMREVPHRGDVDAGGQPSEEVARGKRVPDRTSALRARVARQPAMTLRPAAVIFTTNICVAPPPTLRVGELLTKLLYLWVAG